MAALLAVCTKEEQRAVIRFLRSEGVSGAEIHRRLSTQYGNSRSVYEICQRLLDRYNNEGKEEFLSRIVTGDYTDRATAAIGEVVSTFAGRGCYVVSATDSHGH
jgi:hypothetical protein